MRGGASLEEHEPAVCMEARMQLSSRPSPGATLLRDGLSSLGAFHQLTQPSREPGSGGVGPSLPLTCAVNSKKSAHLGELASYL